MSLAISSSATRSDIEIIGVSYAAEEERIFARRAARTSAPILILGEPGVGKDRLAEYCHHIAFPSERRPFVTVDCGALPKEMAESELFGHERGAFTGAVQSKPGLVEAARNGTLFVNEVGNLPLEMQPKLLRLLEGKSFRRLGSVKENEIRARYIFSTNADLRKEVEQGRMREDLYYRLNVIRHSIPPLRERPEDIPPIVDHFLSRENLPNRFTNTAMVALMDHAWPGNIRELYAVVQRCIFSRQDGEISPDVVSEQIDKPKNQASDRRRLKEFLLDTERKYMQLALATSGGNLSKIAKLSGITRRAIPAKLKRLGLWEQALRLRQPE